MTHASADDRVLSRTVASLEKSDMELSLDHRIRQRAYEIWDATGRLGGQAEQHWLAAEREVLAQMSTMASTGMYTPRENRERKQKLAELKGSYLANLNRIRQANTREERDSAIAEYIDSYIAEVGNDHELADAFLTWLNNHSGAGKTNRTARIIDR